MNEKCKVTVNTVFKLKKDRNDKINLCIEGKNTTDIHEILNQLIKKHEDLASSLKDIDFVPEGVESVTYSFTEIVIMNTFVRTPEWLALKKCVLNPQKNDNKCFQYSVILALYHEQIGKNYYTVSKIKLFVNNFDWKSINFPAQEQDYKTFEMNNKSIALNILCNPFYTEKISYASKSKFNKTREKQVILLIINDGQKQHHVAVKNLNSLLKIKGKCSEHYCLNCLKPFRTKSRLEKHQMKC